MGSKRVGDESEGRRGFYRSGAFRLGCWLVIRTAHMASFHGSVSASRNGGKKASHGCRTRPGVTAGTCRSVNEVYNTGYGIWLMLICPQQLARREHVGGQLINFDIETL
jgi:hypothetical protein